MIGTSVGQAAELLQKEEVVAIPTETVYGLAGNIYSEKAVDRIYTVKNRPRNNPLIVHVASLGAATELVQEFPLKAMKLAEAFWPGPLTLILRKNDKVPGYVTAGQDYVAIRIPAHEATLELLKLVGFPLAAPSANPANYISPVTAAAVEEMIGKKIPYILDGGHCRTGIESTIVAFEGDKCLLLRPGAITASHIAEVTGANLLDKHGATVAHPGMFKKHYAPRTKLLLAADPMEAIRANPSKQIALLRFSTKITGNYKQQVLSANADLEEAARNLYHSLYELDKQQYELIIAEPAPDHGLGKAINDRLAKAAAH